MIEAEFYTTVEQPAKAEYRDRDSKFIAYVQSLTTVNEFKEKLALIKKEHPKATHHCFAYRVGLDGLVFRVSDDGEPSGSAGRPILGQIDSKQLTDVMVVVVRYFGGTLLGVPGLINAYKSAASLALQLTPAVPKPILAKYNLEFDYTRMNDVMRIIKQTDSFVYKQETNLFCSIDVGIPRSRVQETLYKFNEIGSVEARKL
jgi:uncharacterized YigZ family protein